MHQLTKGKPLTAPNLFAISFKKLRFKEFSVPPARHDMKALFVDAGEAARSAALRATSARLTATNTLLHDVATIQRHAEALCPSDHHISDVMSEFSLDEPESSHAVHTELHPEAEPSSGIEPTAPVLSGEETGPFYQPPVNDFNHPQLWDQALARPAADSSGSQATGRAGESCAPVVEMPESSLPAVGLPEFPAVERQSPAVGVQESPLPAMMSELHEAMSASISSAGKPHETPKLWLHCIFLPNPTSKAGSLSGRDVTHHITSHQCDGQSHTCMLCDGHITCACGYLWHSLCSIRCRVLKAWCTCIGVTMLGICCPAVAIASCLHTAHCLEREPHASVQAAQVLLLRACH